MREARERKAGRPGGVVAFAAVALAVGALVGSAPTVAGAAPPKGIPSAPRSVRGTPGNGRATLRWVGPADLNGHPVTQWKIIAYNNRNTPLPTRIFKSTATPYVYVYPGLSNHRTYTFTIAAKNRSGWGPASHRSDPVQIGVPAKPGRPTAVAGKARATVSWKTPNGNGAFVKAYRVTPYVNGHVAKARVFNSPKTKQLLTGLKPHTRYAFSVTAYNNRGWSKPSTPSAAILTK